MTPPCELGSLRHLINVLGRLHQTLRALCGPLSARSRRSGELWGMELVGKRFLDEGSTWIVRRTTKRRHTDGREYVIALYHDVSAQLGEEDLEEHCEWSKHSEVVEFVRRHPAPELAGTLDHTLRLRVETIKWHIIVKREDFEALWTEAQVDGFALAKVDALGSLEFLLAGKEEPSMKLLMGQVMDSLTILGRRMNAALIAGPQKKPSKPGAAWKSYIARTRPQDLHGSAYQILSAVLEVCGFEKTTASNVDTWKPLVEDAVERLIGTHAHKVGGNAMRTLFAFPRRALRKYASLKRRKPITFDPETCITQPYKTSDAGMYNFGAAELGAAAKADDDRMEPAWALRHTLVNQMVDNIYDDTRLRAVSETPMERAERT